MNRRMDMDKHKMKWTLRIIIVLSVFIILLFLGTFSAGVLSPFPYLELDSFKGKVIDAETKKPVAGAAVLAVYFKEVYTVAGSNSLAIDAQEALTDDRGEFIIPGTKRWFVSRRGYTDGKLTIFKRGYGTFPRHTLSKAIGEKYKSWPTPEKYIVYEIPGLKTRVERSRNAFDTDIDYRLPYELQKLIIKEVNREFKRLGLLDRYIEKEGNTILTLEEKSK